MTTAILNPTAVDYGEVRLYKNGKAKVDHEGIRVEALPIDTTRIKVTIYNRNTNTGYVNYTTGGNTESDPHYTLQVAKNFFDKEAKRIAVRASTAVE